MEPIPGILLAAGLSSRMRAFKPLLELGGVPLIVRVLRSFRESAAVEPIYIVSGHRADELVAAIGDGPEHKIVRNPDYVAGEMLSSVRVGIDQLPAGGGGSRGAAGFLLAFADQPAVAADTIRRLVEGFHQIKSPLILPTFRGKRGHPVVISEELIPEIRGLSPSDTLKTVVHRYLHEALLIPVDDPAILEDLDTPEDLARARKKYGGEAGV